MNCLFCRQPLTRSNHHGPVPVYCGPTCRQRAYEIRKAIRELRTKVRVEKWIDGIVKGARG